jgi:hypothetical protein
LAAVPADLPLPWRFVPAWRYSFNFPDAFFTISMKELELNAVLAYDHT